MHLICGITHEGAKFVTDKQQMLLTAEASSLGSRIYETLYDDAADVGFRIINHKTGACPVFHLVDIKRRNGDITEWVFAPTNDSIRRWPPQWLFRCNPE